MHQDVSVSTGSLVVIGTSAGGLNTLERLFQTLGNQFNYPVVVCKHLKSGDEAGVMQWLSQKLSTPLILAQDKMPLTGGSVFLAPGNYHLQIEPHARLSLCAGDRVCHSRPSIDILFETAADVYGECVTAIVLTGANKDGASGVQKVKQAGGTVLVQSPGSAEVDVMPKAAIDTGCVDHILSLDEIADYMKRLVS